MFQSLNLEVEKVKAIENKTREAIKEHTSKVAEQFTNQYRLMLFQKLKNQK